MPIRLHPHQDPKGLSLGIHLVLGTVFASSVVVTAVGWSSVGPPILVATAVPMALALGGWSFLRRPRTSWLFDGHELRCGAFRLDRVDALAFLLLPASEGAAMTIALVHPEAVVGLELHAEQIIAHVMDLPFEIALQGFSQDSGEACGATALFLGCRPLTSSYRGELQRFAQATGIPLLAAPELNPARVVPAPPALT